MIFLDTNAISFLASNSEVQDSFFSFVETEKLTVVIDGLLHLSEIRAGNDEKATERLSLIKRIKNKNFIISHIPATIFEFELESYFLYDELLTAQTVRRNILSEIQDFILSSVSIKCRSTKSSSIQLVFINIL